MRTVVLFRARRVASSVFPPPLFCIPFVLQSINHFGSILRFNGKKLSPFGNEFCWTRDFVFREYLCLSVWSNVRRCRILSQHMLLQVYWAITSILFRFQRAGCSLTTELEILFKSIELLGEGRGVFEEGYIECELDDFLALIFVEKFQFSVNRWHLRSLLFVISIVESLQKPPKASESL